MNTATVISLIIGAEGAVVATTLAVRQVLSDRRSLKVTCQVGYALDRDPPQVLIHVRAVNEGRRPVEVRGVTFRLQDGREVFPPTPVAGGRDIPAVLSDGRSVNVHYDKDALDRTVQGSQSRLAFAVVADAS